MYKLAQARYPLLPRPVERVPPARYRIDAFPQVNVILVMGWDLGRAGAISAGKGEKGRKRVLRVSVVRLSGPRRASGGTSRRGTPPRGRPANPWWVGYELAYRRMFASRRSAIRDAITPLMTGPYQIRQVPPEGLELATQ